MLRLSHAALGAALVIAAACAKQADRSASADSAAPVAATPLTGDSAAPAAAVAPGTASASDSAARTSAAAGRTESAAAGSARTAAPTSTRPAAATARSTAPVAAGGTSAPRTAPAGTTRGAAAVTRSTSPVAAASTTGAATAAPAAAAQAPTSAPAQDQSVKVNQFMSYNPAAKTVTLQVTAALTSQRGGFNFNGGSDGSQTITVPQGWTVRMHVRNVDAIPHSAILIVDQKPLPNAPETPAISRAYTSHVSDGLPAQTGADDVEFRASKTGTFLIYCGVPGHGPSGMYIRFVVSGDAATPSYSM